MKQLLVISYGRLISNGSAGHTVMCGLVEAARAKKWGVTFLGLQLVGQQSRGDIPSLVLQDPGVEAVELEYLRRKPESLKEKLFSLIDPGILEQPKGSLPVFSTPFDRIVAFDALPRRLVKRFSAKDKIVILGDPVGERLQWSPSPPDGYLNRLGINKAFILGKFIEAIEPGYFRKNLPDDVRVALFGSGHANTWARNLGRPVLDIRPFIPAGKVLPPYLPLQSPITLAFGGTLAGTASKKSLEFLFEHLLRGLASQRFSSHILQIIGSVPKELMGRLQTHPRVSLLGRVPDFEVSLATADLFLLPMQYPVGVRTRVCSALQAGCYCVCHSSILYNMPELNNCSAVAIAENHDGLMNAIAAYPVDPVKRQQLRETAKAFFAQHYQADVAASPLLNVALTTLS